MKNRELSDIFEQIADLLEILAADSFRINSYRKAARIVAEMPEAVEDVASADRLTEIPGIGKSTAEKIRQFLRTGKVALHGELLAKVPPGLPDLLAVPGLGPKTVSKLWKQANITSIERLRKSFQAGGARLMHVEGIGRKKIVQIQEALNFIQASGGRLLLGEADELAAELMAQIAPAAGARRVVAAGSLRRGAETIGNIDLLCEATDAAAAGIVKRFTGAGDVRRVLSAGKAAGSVMLEGEVQADLHVVSAESFGAAWAYFTGSKSHNARLGELATKAGMKLNEHGLFRGDRQVAGRDEEGIYEALLLAYVPPELREDTGELAVAAAGKIPQLVTGDQIRGDLHMHTRASDGTGAIDEMIAACGRRGYEYMAICDHSQTQVQARGLDVASLAEHVRAIRLAAKKHPDITVLAGIEVDIFKDGGLDFASDVLGELDFVVASAHSALSQGRKEATRRLIRAIEHPHVNCIGHPSGRLIHSRPGMEIDIDQVARAAAANDVVLEINAHYYRLDLRDTHVRAAIACGAKVMINTDAHSVSELDMMKYGVATARRGWAAAADVVNTYPREQLVRWLARKG